MNNHCRYPIAGLLAICLVPFFTTGCYRTWISGNAWQSSFGPLVDVYVEGEWNTPYVTETKKQVYINIGSDWQHLDTIQHDEFEAADLDWHLSWISPTELVVTLFDYGPTNTKTFDDKVDQKLPKRFFAKLTFVQNQPDGKWVERERILTTMPSTWKNGIFSTGG
jgi:hypothetical protein